MRGVFGPREGGKRELVLCSWLRSQVATGLDARTHAPSVAGADFDRILDGSGRLRAAAGDLLLRAGAMLEDSDAMLLLCDAEGVVMEASGGFRARRQGERNNLQPGGRWSEGAMGTNAIGTALHLRRPVTISDTEHYCAAIRHWACAAVPVRDPADGTLLGVIDISGAPGVGFANAGALATALAGQIEAALRDADLTRHRRLIDLLLAGRPRAEGEAVMLLDQFGRQVWANPAFERLVVDADLPAGETLRQLAAQKEGDAEQAAARLRAALPGADVDLLGAAGGAALGLVVTLPEPAVRRRPTQDVAAPERLSLSRIAATSPTLAPLCASAQKFHDRAIALVLEGAAGVGKTTLARALHVAATGTSETFEMFDCATLDAEALRQTLRTGDGLLRPRLGTLCLVEPARTPAEAQPLLAQVLQRLTRRGGAPLRLISLSSEPLGDAVTAGRLLRDLQLRCSGAVIRLPGLAARRDEIAALLQHFARAAAPPQLRPLRFTAAALAALRGYDWPGNLWEMRDLLSALETGRPGAEARIVDLADLPGAIRNLLRADNRRLQDSERETILNAVAEAEGNLSRAARRLGIARSTLYLKLDQYGVRRRRSRR
ncbi:sigma-54-dependent Fis family transcriptional regulator [Pseudodonghicola flavimaris]|uniref:Helix-turn-helix domain-containing protein n=1 Tax=Pseudodonghicola flavimaris TaxID=3050036 RepID=A0ABT7EW67_9RHOB|nr:helix-turn-helix domain-containing protein [Pseudodonghicola flavimaris]MDK3016576.1 helix-turn-helix domain-containing protein [Pseudodonghicola flavimaris]